ncbi:TetR/AcrR family transcriptional regulator [Umezawaea beigongshangensis]|uniref:TetR/AcrR family transcriptional regulator n=1 Tax=Umezawaea beigongshangensis TaxID=2780383 RepID=UPI0027DE8C6D|nr:TetR/AcrR family transcriptional regulator [Umezawaea beigongshangensis]
MATDLIACDGAGVSLEEIARRAGVGSATLHRHFPSRRALLEEVFHEGVERLCGRARELGRDDPGTGLATWLEELTLYTTNNRGLATSLMSGAGELPPEDTCHGMLLDAADDLVARAVEAGVARPGVSAADLIVLTNAISLATEGDPATAGRLLRLALEGVHP